MCWIGNLGKKEERFKNEIVMAYNNLVLFVHLDEEMGNASELLSIVCSCVEHV